MRDIISPLPDEPEKIRVRILPEEENNPALASSASIFASAFSKAVSSMALIDWTLDDR